MSRRVHRTHPSPPFLQCLYPNLHGFKSTQRYFLCFWLYDLTMTKSRGKKEKKMSLFSGPSLSFYLPGSNIKIAISTIRKYLSPRDVGKVHEIMGSVAASRGEGGDKRATPTPRESCRARREPWEECKTSASPLSSPCLSPSPLLSSLLPHPVLFPPLPPPLSFGWFLDLTLIARRFWPPRLQDLISNIP